MPRFLPRLLARAGRKASVKHRPRLELLEDRATPSAGLDFVPFTTVAVNPSPVPVTALIQFNPLPNVTGIPAAGATFQSPVHIQGTFHQTLTPPSTTGSPVNPPPVRFDVTYSLNGSDSGTAKPPNPATTTPGSFSAQYNLTGTITETVTIPGTSATTLPTVWTITTKLTEQGTVNGPLNRIVTGTPVVDEMTFGSTIGLTQVEAKLGATPLGATPWSVKSTNQSTGKFEVNPLPPTTAAAPPVPTPFTLQNQLTETIAPVASTSVAPPVPIKVTAVDNASGTVTKIPSPFANSSAPLSVTGTTQYKQQLSETIVIPPGPTQPGSTITVNQPFDTTGVFQSFNILSPASAFDLSDIGGQLSPAAPGSEAD